MDTAIQIEGGIQKLIDLGISDPSRIAIGGISFGGYGTLGVITESHLFRAAVLADGFYDAISQYGTVENGQADISPDYFENGQGAMGCALTDCPEKYFNSSPVLKLKNVTAAVLLLHGTDDFLKPSQAEEVYVGLRRLGKPVEYVLFRGEGHGVSSRANQAEQSYLIIDWLKRSLK